MIPWEAMGYRDNSARGGRFSMFFFVQIFWMLTHKAVDMIEISKMASDWQLDVPWAIPHDQKTNRE